MSPRPETVQRFALICMVGVLAMYGALIAAWLKGPESQVEKDEAKANADREAWRESGRVRVVRSRPEWLRRWERKVVGIRRLGDMKLKERSE